jgi:tape measure domain-containing protein
MADISKTVAIVFEGEDKTGATVANVEKRLQEIAQTSGVASVNIEKTGGSIEKIGSASTITADSVRILGDKLKGMAADAGAPKATLDALDSTLLRLGASGTGTIALVATALAAAGVVMAAAGGEAFNFKTKLDNLTGGTEDANAAFGFVQGAVQKLSIGLTDGLDLYLKFTRELEGTGISAAVVEDAFVGISAAIKGQGGDFNEMARGLKAFAEVASDGKITLKELESKIKDDIPGGLRIFSESLGVSVEDLKLLAENNKLGAREIELFAEALRNQDYGSLTPVKDAFVDLWSTIKQIAVDLGAESGFRGALFIIEKAIQTVTATIIGSQATIIAFGETLANIGYTLSSRDFSGFGERQRQVFDNFGSSIENAKNKLFGLKKEIEQEATDKSSLGYQKLADSLRDAGNESETTAEKSGKLGTQLSAAEKENIALAKSAAETEKAIAKQAEEFRKTEEAAQRFAIEMEKIASNERIKFIEAKVKLDIAGLEADTARIESIFGSINSVVSDSSENIRSLFEIFKDPISGLDPRFNVITKQIEEENRVRKEQLELQRKVTEAVIREMEARTRALQGDGAIIKIDGAGLKPHLEAFMWEILRSIQTRVNSDGLELLLGMN